MPFSSYTFLIYILIISIGYLLVRSTKIEKVYLILVSAVFYLSAKYPSYLFILMFYSLLNYVIGKNLLNFKSRKYITVLTVIINLLNLVLFKYIDSFTPFITGNGSIKLDIVLPLGISFYTLKNIAYILDIYYERKECEKNFSNYLLFTLFFPTVSAGPIYRVKEFFSDRLPGKEVNFGKTNQSLQIIAIGLFFKIVIADNLSPYVSRIFDSGLQVTSLNAWISSFAYSLQIYFDFNGYTYIAIGLSMLFGFKVPANFNKPFSAYSITDFWRKWHITLSLWLRDYIFLPLSFYLHRRLPNIKRKNKELLVYSLATTITFAVCGLWHGAGWNYLLWGGFYGLFMVIERATGIEKKFKKSKYSIIVKQVIVFVAVTLLWVLFRADLPRAFQIYRYMFTFNNAGTDVLELLPQLTILVLLIITLTAQYGYLDFFKNIFNRENVYVKILYVVFIVLLYTSIIILKGESDTFIYFKF